MTSRPRLGSVALAFLLAAASARVSAQSVVGTVVDSASRLPIAGAVVQMLGPGGEERSRGLTDLRGTYALRANAEIASVRIVRIGFRPSRTTITTPPGANLRVDVALVRLSAFLDPIRVVAAQCRRRSNRGLSPIGLIEQARAGLLTSIVTREQNPAAMTRITYERSFEGAPDEPTRQILRLDSATAQTRSFSAVQDADAFVRRGFMDFIDGAQYFFAPDAETLLDERFAAGYCFRVMPRDRQRPREVGLGFEPADRRSGRVDVEGALWIDTVARELRALEFTYVGLDRRVEAQQPGGSIRFQSLANGMVIVDRWDLRMIGAVTDTLASSRGGTSRTRQRLIELRSGGELTAATWQDGTRWEAMLGRVEGVARWRDDSVAAGALIALAGTPYRAQVDSAGRFKFTGLIPGRFRVVVVDSALLRIGLGIPTELRLRSDRDRVEQDMELPTRVDVTEAQCRAQSFVRPTARPTYLLARALRDDGTPIEDAIWTLRGIEGGEWEDIATNGRTGSDGMMPYCSNLRRGMMIELLVRSPEGLTSSQRLRLDEAVTVVPVVFPTP